MIDAHAIAEMEVEASFTVDELIEEFINMLKNDYPNEDIDWLFNDEDMLENGV